jgi:dipeptidyl-peptidase 4
MTDDDKTAATNLPDISPEADADTYPRQYARTRRFSLGEPRNFRISSDGERITFLRSSGGSDPFTRLWILEKNSVGAGWTERLVVDPADLGRAADGELPPEELARRERLREQADGITAYDIDIALTRAVFALNGAVYVADLSSGIVQSLATKPGAYDPRLSPDGRWIAYISERSLRIIGADPASALAEDRIVMGEVNELVQWGVVDFNAAEEFNRYRGFWWSPDSQTLLAERVDDTPVQSWWISDPANPHKAPRPHLYPMAGTDNAIVSLAFFSAETLHRTDVDWAREGATHTHVDWPYLVEVSWSEEGCTLVLMNRAQNRQRVVDCRVTDGALRTMHDVTDPVWTELMPGTPHRFADGSLLIGIADHVAPRVPPGIPDGLETGIWPDPEGTHALAIVEPNGARRVITPANLQIRRVAQVTTTHALVTACASRPLDGTLGEQLSSDPAAISVLRVALDGSSIDIVAGGPDLGVHDVDAAHPSVAVLRSASVQRTRAEHRVHEQAQTAATVRSFAEVALANPKPHFFRVGLRAFSCALLLPERFDSLEKIPVLLDPYGGPHAQRVVRSRNAHASSQWFADQGFAVLIVDGRGTPGLGPIFEKEIQHDFATAVLEDQVEGLQAAAAQFPQLDLTRVGIRGWSFGGYLAALAVLDRPDVFHCAIAGAPVTEWRLYDTGYTERYLGDPRTQPEIYDRSSLLTRAHKLTRPLMIIHGLADDNVVAAHTLQLSSALLAHGKAHEVLPLSGVTHMTPQEIVAENLLKLQVDFLKRHLTWPSRT